MSGRPGTRPRVAAGRGGAGRAGTSWHNHRRDSRWPVCQGASAPPPRPAAGYGSGQTFPAGQTPGEVIRHRGKAGPCQGSKPAGGVATLYGSKAAGGKRQQGCTQSKGVAPRSRSSSFPTSHATRPLGENRPPVSAGSGSFAGICAAIHAPCRKSSTHFHPLSKDSVFPPTFLLEIRLSTLLQSCR